MDDASGMRKTVDAYQSIGSMEYFKGTLMVLNSYESSPPRNLHCLDCRISGLTLLPLLPLFAKP